MSDFVIDTNVAVVADRRGPSNTTEGCILAAIAALRRVQKSDRLVLDAGGRILAEYTENVRTAGQPGPDQRFLRWVHRHQYNEQRCVRVAIHVRGDEGEDYEEFPDAADLTDFDRSDRKFVAVALARGPVTPIIQATDAEWWRRRHALASAGVRIEFICPDDIQRSHRALLNTR